MLECAKHLQEDYRLLEVRRGPVVSPIMFHHEDSPYTTHRTTVIINITSTSQGPKVIIAGSRGSQDFPINPTTNVENVDVREYHFDFEGEHITIAEW